MTSYVVYQQLPHTAEEENYDDMDDGFTIAQGPSSYRMVYSYADYYESMDCKFKGQSVASCFLSQHDTTTTNVDSIVTTATDMPFFPVTITATESGAASVATNKATATPILATVSTPTVTAASTLSNSASQSSASSSDSPSGTEATASSTGSSNSAMAQVTGKAHWLVGGAAMALALAMA
ncbi:putative GPI anchored glycoprotein [Aspergillus tanneri]|nr:uncharacterized protein ATNIH1004_011226 [Aspergillus tanneri]KAA8642284.1 hypothetical protein ATNIH1004_011226 [Aspergillus tanneri]